MATAQQVILALPTGIQGCALWLDAADAATFTLSGANVTQWNDKSGNARHAVLQNTFTGATVSTYNSNSALTLAGTSRYLITFPNFPNGEYTVFTVQNNTNNANNGTNSGYQRVLHGSQNNAFLFFGTFLGNLAVFTGNGSAWNDTSATATTNFNTWRIVGSIVSGTSLTIFADGTSVSTKTGTTSAFSNLLLGNDDANTQGFIGNLGEVIILPRAVSLEQRQFIEGYLAWKWGMTSSLPANHPYRTLRPYAAPPFPLVVPPTSGRNTLLWQPNVLPNLNLWLDSFDSTRTTFASLNVIQSVLDKSANAYTMTVENTNPTINRDARGAYNFQDSFQMLTYPVAAMNNTNNYNIFLVATFQSQAQILMSKQADYVNTMNTLGLGWFPGGQLAGQLGQLIWWPSNSGGFSNPTALSTNTTYLIQIGYDAATMIFRINGVQTSTITTATGTIINEAQGQPRIGNMWSGFWGANKFGSTPAVQNWNLHEMLFYNSYRNLSQQQAIEGYLAWKWGIASSLPTVHPFYTNPPFITGTFPTNTGAVFSPTSIGNCILWLDAADRTTLTLTGSSVNQWRDKSASAQHCTGGGTTLPRYIEGENAIALFGAGFLSNTTLSYALSQRSVFIVCRQTGSSSNAFEGILVFASPTTQDYSSSNAIVYNGRGSNVNANTSFGVYFNGTYIQNYLNFLINTPYSVYSDIFSTNSGTTYVNGNLNTTVALSSGSVGTSTGYFVGARNDSPPPPRSLFNGSIYEIIAYNTALSAAQRQQVEGYLTWKWGLQSNLPTSHPFKNNQNYVVPNIPMVPRRQAWLPTRISGCTLWFDAADFTTFTFSSGSNISLWRDKSDSGNNLQQATPSAQPSLSNLIGTTLPAVYFLNQPIQMTTVSNNPLTGNTSRNMFVVCQARTATSIVRIGTGGHTGTSPPNTFGFDLNNPISNVWVPYVYTAADNVYTSTITNTVCLEASYNSNTSVLGGGINFTQTPTRSTTLNTSANAWFFGLRPDSVGSSNSFICEYILYNSALSPSQRQQVEGYLAWKWGIQSSLPGSHPFSKFPPL